jgi:hypothetical protein
VQVDDIEKGTPLADFIVGHELSHIRHRDPLRGGAENKVLHGLGELINNTRGLKENSSYVEVRQQVADMTGQSRREKEYRSDDEGFEFALSRGHSPKEIVEAAKSELPDWEKFDTAYLTGDYPSDYHRIQALEKKAQKLT